jgi:hypothetical protein
MIAYRFQRFYACASPCFKKIGLLLVQSLICLGLLTACQTKRAVSKEAGAENRPALAQKPVESANSTSNRKPGGAPAPTEKPRPALPPPRSQTLAEQVAIRLSSSFAVKPEGSDALRIEKAPVGAAAPSLFEEAIILGKLRAILNSSSPAGPNASVSFQAGKAVVSLPHSINSGTASVLIVKMLALDGVNELRADFGR